MKTTKNNDKKRVHAWMNQPAWYPSSGPYPEEKAGDIIYLGNRSPARGKRKQPIPWIVLCQNRGKALLITQNGLKCYTFMDDNTFNWGWEHSWIRNWLNTSFYWNSFSPEERNMIQPCVTDYSYLFGWVNKYDPVYDRVFLLNDAEANLFFTSNEARIIRGTPDDVSIFRFQKDENDKDWWWLRSQGSEEELACCVDPDGCIDRNGLWMYSSVCAIRPAILVDLSCGHTEIERLP